MQDQSALLAAEASVPAPSQDIVTLVTIGNYLLFIGSFIVIATKDKTLLGLAAYIKLLGGLLFITAAQKESQEQQIAPGVTTTANKLKLAGSSISELGAILLTIAFQRETALQTPTSGTVISPFTGVGIV